MGCTSSAPNMADIQSNATDDTEKHKSNGTEDTRQIRKIENNMNFEQNQKNLEVLPPCDNNLNNNINLPTNSNSTDLKCDEDCAAKGSDLKEDWPVNEIPENNKEDEKITTFKEVADKVIEEIHTEEIKEIAFKDEPKQETTKELRQENTTESTTTKQCNIDIVTEAENIVEVIEEDTENKEHESPSQSECSRSTRWEALADIAAELPPSLAVDPVTGQIYSLSK